MTVGILGLGLIGGSLARAYKLAGHKVLCCDTDQDMLSFAMVAGVVDEKMTDDNISECDLILLAIYPDGCIQWMQQHASHIRNHTIVMDCCGTKREVCNHCFPIAQEYGFTFIGAHPMAGNQFSGFKYSRADLFIGAPMVLVPHRFDDMELLEQAKKSGYVRVRIDGNLYELTEEIKLEKNVRHDVSVVVDRLVVKPGIQKRLTDSLETALKLADGLVEITVVGGEKTLYSTKYSCPDCGVSLEEIEPRLRLFLARSSVIYQRGEYHSRD